MRKCKMWIAAAMAVCTVACASNAQVRISQVFSGAGCATVGCSAYNNDYIELYNAGAVAVDLSTWSVQYQSATAVAAFTTRTNLAGSIPAGGYYLVQQPGNANGLAVLPAPDATGTIMMSAGAGKVALVSTQAFITSCVDAAVVDLVGYGATANCSEGTVAPAPGNNFNAIFRALNGCTDTNVNSADFAPAPAAPRNTSNTNSCGATNGACCVSNVCSVTTLAGCSGTFQGLGTTCSPDPCLPPPIGACCVNGICVGDQTASACAANGTGSSWGGAGTTCATFICPEAIGSCCNGVVCTAGVAQSLCITGTFTVNNTCTPNPCDPSAACCFSNSSCLIRPSVECATLTGIYQGIGSVCSPSPCPPALPGACCTGAACAVSADALTCFTSGGQFKGAGSVCVPSPCFVASGAIIATYDFDANIVGSPATNLTFSALPDNPTGIFSNAFDVFGVINRTVNADFADNSFIGMVVATDSQGVFREAQTSNAFGVEDLLNLDNSGGTGTATWTFNVAGFTNLNISIDFAAMGNFEEFGFGLGSVLDSFNFTYSIDGNPAQPLFTSQILEGVQPTYTLESGQMITTNFNDPVAINGTLILNQFQTLAAQLAGSGSTLTLTFNTSGDGGSEVFVFDNINIRGTTGVVTGACCDINGICTNVTSAACVGPSVYSGDGTTCSVVVCATPTGACCNNVGLCTATTSALCGFANSIYQGNGSVCNPNPCAPATGACCCGSNCTITTAAACIGTNRSFAGIGTVCTPFSNQVPCCRGDYNKSGSTPTVQDIFDFLTGYFSADSCADTNDSTGISVQDIFDFLTAYFSGC